MKWELTTGGDVSATPAVDGDAVYVPDWAGNLYAVDRATGRAWQTSIARHGVPFDKARATPAVTEDKVISAPRALVRRRPGQGLRVRQVHRRAAVEHPGGPPPRGDHHPVGHGVRRRRLRRHRVAGRGARGLRARLPVLLFRGSMLALDLDTGAILWKTYMTPAGYTGQRRVGQLARDRHQARPGLHRHRQQLHVRRDRRWTASRRPRRPAAAAACLPADDHFDSILALDMRTGAIKWATRAMPFDTWTVDCIPSSVTGATVPSRRARTSTSARLRRCSRSRTATGKAIESSAPARRAASTGRSTPTPAPSVGDPGRARRDGRRAAVGLRGRRQARLHGQREQQRHPLGAAWRRRRPRGVWSGLDAATGASAVADTPAARRRHLRAR